MDKTPCRYCGRVGLIRFEVVVRGSDASLTYECGDCNKTWTEPDRRSTPRMTKEPPAPNAKA